MDPGPLYCLFALGAKSSHRAEFNEADVSGEDAARSGRAALARAKGRPHNDCREVQPRATTGHSPAGHRVLFGRSSVVIGGVHPAIDAQTISLWGLSSRDLPRRSGPSRFRGFLPSAPRSCRRPRGVSPRAPRACPGDRPCSPGRSSTFSLNSPERPRSRCSRSRPLSWSMASSSKKDSWLGPCLRLLLPSRPSPGPSKSRSPLLPPTRSSFRSACLVALTVYPGLRPG